MNKKETKKCTCCTEIKPDNGHNNLIYNDWVCDSCYIEINKK